MSQQEGLDLDEMLPQVDRILSPSDFGFHNVILTEQSGPRFIDFEYAGWDDPAKTAADFFFQPQIPAPKRYRKDFLNACLQHSEQDRIAHHIRRAKILLPLIGLRWVRIVLNPLDLGTPPHPNQIAESGSMEALVNARLDTAEAMLAREELQSS